MSRNIWKYCILTIAFFYISSIYAMETDETNGDITEGRGGKAKINFVDFGDNTDDNSSASVDMNDNDNSSQQQPSTKQKMASIDEVMQLLPGVDPNSKEEQERIEFYKNHMDTYDNILDINKHVGNEKELFEGDVRKSIFRNAGGGSPWPKSRSGSNKGLAIIPYKISNEYDSTQKNIIKSALNTFQKYTCIRFVPRTNERSYINVQDSEGCWAYVGKTNLPGQTVSLGIPGCVSKGIALHELMHTLGFQHEQSRSDRDNYIKVIGENIEGGWNSNFDKLSYTSNLVVYDYGSVLHYGKTSFSKYPYLPSIEVFPKRNPSPSFGQRTRLSPYDIEEIKYLYDCDPGTYPRCGRDFNGQARGSFNSPKYPQDYEGGSHCTWGITVASRKYVEIEFTNVDIEDSPSCQKDAILVHDGVNAAAPILQKVCGNHASVTITASGRNMFVIFSSDGEGTAGGFRATFRQVSTPGRKQSLYIPRPTLAPITRTIQRFSCSFDYGICGLTQDQNDNLDFTLNSGNTPTRGTGPSSDHNSGRGKYLYLESSLPAVVGDIAVIRTPWFKSGRLCVTFSYNMLGLYMGGMRLYAFVKTTTNKYGTAERLWEKHGDQGSDWKTVQVDFSPSSSVQNVQFYFEGFVYYYLSDMAIDDLRIDPGRCPRVPRKVIPTQTSATIQESGKTTIPTTQSQAVTPSKFNCNFESGTCGMVQLHDDDFDWERYQGATPSGLTGPLIDYSEKSESGYYMYVEASSPRSQHDTASIATPALRHRNYCVKFAYSMYGASMGSLTVSSMTGSSTRQVTEWQKFGNHGLDWQEASFEYRVSSNNANSVQFVFTARIGSGFRSDMAIDAINIAPGRCTDGATVVSKTKPRTTTTTTTTTSTTTTTTTAPAKSDDSYEAVGMPKCTFEPKQSSASKQQVPPNSIPGKSTNDLGDYIYPANIQNDRSCGFKQEKNGDRLDWRFRNGSTPTGMTGPSSDKTTGQGWYMYAEASARAPGYVATTYTYSMPAADYCLRFFYHMYGADMGRLRIRSVQQLNNNQKDSTVIRQIIGDKGDQWKRMQVNFKAADNAVSVRFNFEAVVGSTSRSDIALDDIAILPGACAACKAPTHTYTTNTKRTRKFATGCINNNLFFVRCCSLSQVKFVYRRVRQCNGNMFPSVRLNWYCENL